MIRKVSLMIFLLGLILTAGVTHAGNVQSGCTFNGKKLFGKIQIVTSFPDVKVQEVTSFPDLKVQKVSSFADSCGKWEIVNSFPDTKVQFVTSFPDIKIQYVTSFPGPN
ncbi:hypothetical protein AB3N59_02630 [Leptospira sp. WS92.C1]